MKGRVIVGFVLAAALGCQLPQADQEAYRPLREHGPRPRYDDMVSRARRQADLALEASYNDNWGDLADLAKALRQTAQLLPEAPERPDARKLAEVRKTSAALSRDATRLHAAAREVTRLTGEKRLRKVREVNDLLISINRVVRTLRPEKD